MPQRLLRFCPTCLYTQQAAARERCGCGTALLPLLDDGGALSATFLAARGHCCASGCRNCPYPHSPPPDQAFAAPAAGNVPTCSKICERCGSAFGCHGDACWCGGVRLSGEALDWLTRRYADCLCPECLSALAAQ